MFKVLMLVKHLKSSLKVVRSNPIEVDLPNNEETPLLVKRFSKLPVIDKSSALKLNSDPIMVS